MATSKTLTPTNVTISIPAFTDKPDQRLTTNCIDKEADAINALETRIDTFPYQKLITSGSLSSRTFSVPNSFRGLIVGISGYSNRHFASILISSSGGAVTETDVYKGSDVTINTSTNNKLTVSHSAATGMAILVFTTSSSLLSGFTLDG